MGQPLEELNLMDPSSWEYFLILGPVLSAAAVECCVLFGLKRRAAGFLRSNKIAALFMKVGKSFPLAEELCRKVQDLEQLIENA